MGWRDCTILILFAFPDMVTKPPSRCWRGHTALCGCWYSNDFHPDSGDNINTDHHRTPRGANKKGELHPDLKNTMLKSLLLVSVRLIREPGQTRDE